MLQIFAARTSLWITSCNQKSVKSLSELQDDGQYSIYSVIFQINLGHKQCSFKVHQAGSLFRWKSTERDWNKESIKIVLWSNWYLIWYELDESKFQHNCRLFCNDGITHSWAHKVCCTVRCVELKKYVLYQCHEWLSCKHFLRTKWKQRILHSANGP